MGIIGRLKRVTVGRLEAFLASVEDPEVVFPQLIREMEDQVRAATEAEAQALAAVKAAERSRDEAAAKLATMGDGAAAALAQGDEPLAREALAAQVRFEAEVARRTQAVDTARKSCDEAHGSRVQLEAQLTDIRSKKDEILTRARVARAQEKTQRTVQGPVASSGSILDAVARLEAHVEEQEATLAVRKDLASGGDRGGSASLERRIEALASGQEIERRLAALREKLKKPSA